MNLEKEERHQIVSSIFYPLVLVSLLWIIKLTEYYFHVNFTRFGLLPRSFSHLTGIITCPLIHSSFNHLFSNSLPLLVLGMMTFYFYRPIAFSVFFWVYLMSGLWLWAAGREAFHLGASGLVYGFASFLFFSGIFRREKTTMVLSLLVVFLYGSMIWGLFPIDPQISWESHLLGSLAGFITAYYFRKEGPQQKRFEWEDEPEEEADTKDQIPGDDPL